MAELLYPEVFEMSFLFWVHHVFAYIPRPWVPSSVCTLSSLKITVFDRERGVHVYVKYDLRFSFARCPPAAECFFSHFRPRCKLACHGYIMKHA